MRQLCISQYHVLPDAYCVWIHVHVHPISHDWDARLFSDLQSKGKTKKATSSCVPEIFLTTPWTSPTEILEEEIFNYGLLIRCRRICTEDHYFEEEAKKIHNQLKLKYRKYSTNLLNQAIKRVPNIDRLPY